MSSAANDFPKILNVILMQAVRRYSWLALHVTCCCGLLDDIDPRKGVHQGVFFGFTWKVLIDGNTITGFSFVFTFSCFAVFDCDVPQMSLFSSLSY